MLCVSSDHVDRDQEKVISRHDVSKNSFDFYIDSLYFMTSLKTVLSSIEMTSIKIVFRHVMSFICIEEIVFRHVMSFICIVFRHVMSFICTDDLSSLKT